MRMPPRRPLRPAEYFIEENSLAARLRFVHRHPGRTTSAALKEIERGLDEGIRALARQPESRGGPKPLTFRKNLLVNLADIWTVTLGRQVSTGPKSDFVSFCESVVEAIGWDIEGVFSAIPDALECYRLNLLGKRQR